MSAPIGQRGRSYHDEIDIERERAHAKHGETSMRSQPWTSHRRVSILTEEVGEVARVLNDFEHGIHDMPGARIALRHELVQVAAMAVDWLADVDAYPESGDSGETP